MLQLVNWVKKGWGPSSKNCVCVCVCVGGGGGAESNPVCIIYGYSAAALQVDIMG